MTEIPTSEVLNRAADLIEERGWGKGPASIHGIGGTCLMGAIYVAAHGAYPTREEDAYTEAVDCPTSRAVFDYLHGQDEFMERPSEIWHWNDRRAESAEQVVEVLRACAVIEASREREAAEVSPEPVSA